MASFVAIVVVTVLLAFLYRQVATSQLIEQAKRQNVALIQVLAKTLWPEFGAFLMTDMDMPDEELQAHPETTRFREAVLAQLADLSVIKIKGYNLDGHTVFSTEAGQIGEDKSQNAGFLAARDKQVASELTFRDTFSAFEDTIEDRNVISSYVAIQPDEMTLRLATAMGVPEAELVHVRRGALLHDIGKMGIPDSILLKPGPLSESEWEIMRMHPVYAYEMLSPIGYLRSALDIPYCHHEKWDGSGYPRGLAGEQIPLHARIFAVADVWDSLLSHRPYRSEVENADALEYICEEAGQHFDPNVVNCFVQLVADGD